MKIETIKSYLKILLSLIKLENKLSLIQALKINTVRRVTRLQSKTYKRVTRLYLSEGRVTRLQERKDYKSLSEGKGELSWTWELNFKILTWKMGPGHSYKIIGVLNFDKYTVTSRVIEVVETGILVIGSFFGRYHCISSRIWFSLLNKWNRIIIAPSRNFNWNPRLRENFIGR